MTATAGNGMAGPLRCETCSLEMVTIRMTVDGNDLVMESCQRCDVRRWHLAGQQIDLEQALAQVGEHVGRRR
jgi:DNA polymerase III alpha subunit (gram-positive type)